MSRITVDGCTYTEGAGGHVTINGTTYTGNEDGTVTIHGAVQRPEKKVRTTGNILQDVQSTSSSSSQVALAEKHVRNSRVSPDTAVAIVQSITSSSSQVAAIRAFASRLSGELTVAHVIAFVCSITSSSSQVEALAALTNVMSTMSCTEVACLLGNISSSSSQVAALGHIRVAGSDVTPILQCITSTSSQVDALRVLHLTSEDCDVVSILQCITSSSSQVDALRYLNMRAIPDAAAVLRCIASSSSQVQALEVMLRGGALPQVTGHMLVEILSTCTSDSSKNEMIHKLHARVLGNTLRFAPVLRVISSDSSRVDAIRKLHTYAESLSAADVTASLALLSSPSSRSSAADLLLLHIAPDQVGALLRAGWGVKELQRAFPNNSEVRRQVEEQEHAEAKQRRGWSESID